MRVLEFDNQFAPKELADALLSGGYPKWMTLQQIADGHAIDDADDEVTLDCVIDEDDAIERISDEAILQAAQDIRAKASDEHLIEDAIRYVRDGQLSLASAVFPRIFEGAELHAVERALHS